MVKFEQININDLKPADYNPRIMPQTEMQKLTTNLKTYGLVDPIIIDLTDDNTVIGGHQRLEVLKNINDEQELHLLKLGDIGLVFKELDFKIKDKNDQKALNLSLNKIKGEWDYNLLDNLLVELQEDNYNIELTGFDETDLLDIDYEFEFNSTKDETQNIEIIEDDYDITDEIETNIKIGDLFKLGNHKLLCADATKKENYNKLITNNHIHLLFTDPPFDFKQTEFFKEILTNIEECFILGSHKYLVQLAYENFNIFRYFFTIELTTANLINNNMPMTQNDLIAYFRKGKTNFKNLKDCFTTHIISNKLRKKGVQKKHQKSVELPSQFIIHYTNKNDNVLDIFGGTGTTLIACEQLNRNCYMMENEPMRCQGIIDRWENMTKQKAIKLN